MDLKLIMIVYNKNLNLGHHSTYLKDPPLDEDERLLCDFLETLNDWLLSKLNCLVVFGTEYGEEHFEVLIGNEDSVSNEILWWGDEDV